MVTKIKRFSPFEIKTTNFFITSNASTTDYITRTFSFFNSIEFYL